IARVPRRRMSTGSPESPSSVPATRAHRARPERHASAGGEQLAGARSSLGISSGILLQTGFFQRDGPPSVSLFKAAAPVFVVLVVLLVQAELPPNVGGARLVNDEVHVAQPSSSFHSMGRRPRRGVARLGRHAAPAEARRQLP